MPEWRHLHGIDSVAVLQVHVPTRLLRKVSIIIIRSSRNWSMITIQKYFSFQVAVKYSSPQPRLRPRLPQQPPRPRLPQVSPFMTHVALQGLNKSHVFRFARVATTTTSTTTSTTTTTPTTTTTTSTSTTTCNPCQPNPCQNGGTCCPTSPNTFICQCPMFYSGPYCSIFNNPCYYNG